MGLFLSDTCRTILLPLSNTHILDSWPFFLCTPNTVYFCDFSSHHLAIPDTLCAFDPSWSTGWHFLSTSSILEREGKCTLESRVLRGDEDTEDHEITGHKQKQARSTVLLKTFKEVLRILSTQALWAWRQINTQDSDYWTVTFVDREHSLYSAQLNIYNSHTIHGNHNSYV